MPSKIKKRGENSYLLTVANGYNANKKQQVFTKTITATGIEDARKQYNQFMADCLQGKVLVSGTEKMTLIQFYDYWKEHTKHEETTIAYNDNLFQRIEIVLGPYRLDKIVPHHLLDFFKQISAPDAGYKDKPLSDLTIKKHYILLNTLFSAAVKWKFLSDNPMKSIDTPKVSTHPKKILSDDELSKLLIALEKEPLKHQLWVMIAFGCGLRREEIFGLKWGDLNIKALKIEINRAVVYVAKKPLIEKDTKTDNSYRVLPMPCFLADMLLNWQNELRAAVKRRNKRKKIVSIEDEDPTAPDKWVFPQANGNCGHPCSFTTFVRRFCKEEKLASASPHLFRHMCGSYLFRDGTDLATISKELGHGDRAFTMRTYIHEIETEREKTAAAMDRIVENLKPSSVTPIKKGQA